MQSACIYWYVRCIDFTGSLRLKLDDILNCLVNYTRPVPTVAVLDGHNFLLPANCQFLLSDISHMAPLLSGKLYVYVLFSFLWLQLNSLFVTLFYMQLTRLCLHCMECSAAEFKICSLTCWEMNGMHLWLLHVWNKWSLCIIIRHFDFNRVFCHSK